LTKNKIILLIVFSIGCLLLLAYKAIQNQDFSYLIGVVTIIVILFFKKREYDRNKERMV
jgi:ABC-type dipeptide/oligopeptide/nickel transport system permease component